MTTVGSLAIVFFLPEQQRVNLVDFSAVMIVNLMISIVVALIFVPALMDKLPIAPRKRKNTRRKMRRLLRFNRIYGRYILFGKRHKWIFIVVMILGIRVAGSPAARADQDRPESRRQVVAEDI